MEFRPNLFHRTKILSVAMIISCALLAPVKTHAQNDQPIIMTCGDTPVHVTLTINLADKTARFEMNDTRPEFQSPAYSHPLIATYPISGITDQEITMSIPEDTAGQYYILNRYTGDLRMITPAYPNSPNLYGRCQKQQKQF